MRREGGEDRRRPETIPFLGFLLSMQRDVSDEKCALIKKQSERENRVSERGDKKRKLRSGSEAVNPTRRCVAGL